MKQEYKKKTFTLVTPSFTSLFDNSISVLSLSLSTSVTTLILNYSIVYIKAIVF